MLRHCCTISKFKPVTHVIFDLDGTIIDSEGVYAEALQLTVEDYGKEYPPNLNTKIAGQVQKDVAKSVIEMLNLDTTNEDFQEKYVGHATEKLGNLDLMPGAEKLIRHLYNHNVPIAIATSSNQDSMELKTAKYPDLFSLFHHIVCGGTDPEVAKGKPNPDIFLLAASRFDDKPSPDKCLVFEDSANGVKAGLAAGMQVIMIPEDHVPYEIWKTATLRLDSMECMVPQLFGLPAFDEGEPIFAPNLENIEQDNQESNEEQ